jgi:DNA-binding GntR family transcriptional regulator
LPSERELADHFNVSYLTLRRAIGEMVDRGILERRPRSGTYLKPEGHRRLNNQSLMLVRMGYESDMAKRSPRPKTVESWLSANRLSIDGRNTVALALPRFAV